MQMNGNQAADFVKILYPTLQKANLSHVLINCCEATGWSAARSYTQALQGVNNMMGVITSHTYTSGISGTQPTSLKVWQTEFCDLNGGWSTAWYSNGGAGDGFTWANTIYTGLTTGNLSAYLWWEGVQDRATNNNNNEKLILVEATTYQVAKRLWAFAQYSRTVRPGAVRIGASGGTGLRTTAFINVDGSVAVVIINSGTSAASVSISGVTAKSATSWVTDNTRDMVEAAVTVDVDGAVSGVSVPGRGVASVVITPAA
jgi:O-glycosyl hydrolase